MPHSDSSLNFGPDCTSPISLPANRAGSDSSPSWPPFLIPSDRSNGFQPTEENPTDTAQQTESSPCFELLDLPLCDPVHEQHYLDDSVLQLQHADHMRDTLELVHPPSLEFDLRQKCKFLAETVLFKKSKHSRNEEVNLSFAKLHITAGVSPPSSSDFDHQEQHLMEIQQSVVVEEIRSTEVRRFIRIKKLVRMQCTQSDAPLMSGSSVSDSSLFESMNVGVAGFVLPPPPNDCACMELSWDWPPTCNSNSEKLCDFSSAGGVVSFGS